MAYLRRTESPVKQLSAGIRSLDVLVCQEESSVHPEASVNVNVACAGRQGSLLISVHDAGESLSLSMRGCVCEGHCALCLWLKYIAKQLCFFTGTLLGIPPTQQIWGNS